MSMKLCQLFLIIAFAHFKQKRAQTQITLKAYKVLVNGSNRLEKSLFVDSCFVAVLLMVNLWHKIKKADN